MKDIAAYCRVSRSTVSRVINGDPNVKERTRQKVLDAIEALGYRPNRIAQGLKHGRYSFAGVVVDQMSDITSVIIQEIERCCRAAGYTLALCIARDDPSSVSVWIEENAYVEGIVYLMGGIHEIPWNCPEAIPSVFAYCFPRGTRENCIYPDNVQGASDAVRYLLGLGHRRIAYVNGPPRWEAHRSRLAGYLQAMAEAGAHVDEAWIVEGNGSFESGVRLGHQLLSLPAGRRPTAIFACSDRMAAGVMAAARERGMAVPEELSVVGYENREFAEYLSPKLTTVHLPLKEVGTLAAGRLFDAIQNNRHEPWPETKVGCRLVVRGSAGPPAS